MNDETYSLRGMRPDEFYQKSLFQRLEDLEKKVLELEKKINLKQDREKFNVFD